ncbi:uncharacterized protein LOC118514572 [Anopheles stephensi]|uniref:CBM39 domain-containing protein n=1 Tax=Anopheles stephensi TaxID=30069 RepID=A0A182YCI9_ANOST|nr:uncharacterized protein LOC118514572 [Anopheles stephensi]
MRLGVILLFLAVTTVVVAGVRVRNDRHRIEVCRKFNRQIEIFRPQGLTVRQSVWRSLRSLDLELYVNQAFRERPSCDVCANVTVTGRARNPLIIHNRTVIIRPGDTVQYSVTKRYRRGRPKRFSCEFTVNGDLMKLLTITSSPRSCPAGVPTRPSRNYEEEQKLLWNIITDSKIYCDAAELTNLLVLHQDSARLVSEADIKDHLVKRLRTLVPSLSWDEIVEDVRRSQGMYFFGVKSILLKREILQMIRGSTVESIITDFDKLDLSAVRNTDGSGDGGSGSEDYVDYGSGLAF